jgi:Spy/CpxP family protein refolding chaperone
MWRGATFCLVLASLGLNLAFAGVWVAHAWPARTADQPQPAVWCPLHRALEVTPEQWAEIEPRLREFQAAVGELCSQTDGMRSEVIDLIAAEEPDLKAIQAKQEEVLATKRRIQRLVVEHLLAERAVLTAEQSRQLFAMLRQRTGCAADPPMSGRPRGGLGRVLQHRDATLPDDVNR